MGEGTDRVDGKDDVEDIAMEIDFLRREMTPLVDELDRRRREALDWRVQAREHAVPVAVAAVVFALGSGWLLWSAIQERRRRRLPVEKMRRLRRAISRMVDDPDRVATAGPSGLRSLGLAVARTASTAAASILAKRAVGRLSTSRV